MSYLTKLLPDVSFRGHIPLFRSAAHAVGDATARVIRFSHLSTGHPDAKVKSVAPGGGKADSLQLVLDVHTHQFILALAEEIEAASVAELFRRAVMASELYIPEENEEARKLTVLVPANPAKMKDVKRLNIPVSGKTRERLDRLKAATGATSYASVARDAFLVFAQLVENDNRRYDSGDGSSEELHDVAVV